MKGNPFFSYSVVTLSTKTNWTYHASSLESYQVSCPSQVSADRREYGLRGSSKGTPYFAKTGMCCRTGYGFQDLES